MQTNSCEKKQKDQEPYRAQTHPRIYAQRDNEQNAVFDNAKPARLRMQGDVFFPSGRILSGSYALPFFAVPLSTIFRVPSGGGAYRNKPYSTAIQLPKKLIWS